jgi:hypothetical protein
MTFHAFIKWIAAAALAGMSGLAVAATCSGTSPKHTVALLELFTSEGCSSCPPADAWLRKLPGAGYGADRVVPLALHVDYWDYIGWQDRFASPRYTERQKAYSAIGRSRFIYTPQVVLDGRDFRGWSNSGAFEQTVSAANARPARATITVNLDEKEPGVAHMRISAELSKDAAGSRASLYVATFENGHTTNVKAGENRGATLEHDYVVRQWFGPISFDGDGRAELVERVFHSARGGVAAFVQSHSTGDVLQATALAHCRAG